MTVRSDAFSDASDIPVDYTAEGQNISPPIAWEQVPPGTESFAILAEDLDSPEHQFVHWIVVGLTPETTELVAGAHADLPAGAKHGTNDFGNAGWGGPDPKRGPKRHRYVFHIYALDRALTDEGITKPALLAAIDGHVLAEGQLVGLYQLRNRDQPSQPTP
ncbi:MAG: YbhB/YbcL family Raf kinase inhibitor-like protein [Kofleriaceae bacterium]